MNGLWILSYMPFQTLSCQAFIEGGDKATEYYGVEGIEKAVLKVKNQSFYFYTRNLLECHDLSQ